MIDPRSVQVFWWVVELGGFSRAAEQLGTTQPAVSARIAALETAVGARLLERGRRPGLTAAGLVMRSYAERLLTLQAEMEAAFAGPVAGAVRLGVSETLVHTWLSALLRRLHEAYPQLELEIEVDASAGLRASLLGGEIDVALLLGPVAAAGVEDLALCAHALAWVAGPQSTLGPGLVGLEAVGRVPVMTYARGTAPYREVRALFPGRKAPRVFASASVASIIRMVADGIGVGVVARAAVAGELDRGTLRELQVDAVLSPLRFTASWRSAGGVAAAVARMAREVAVGAG